MSYGHGGSGPIRDVVDVLSGWSAKGRMGGYVRKVRLSCGHFVAQVGNRSSVRVVDDGSTGYQSDDIRNLKTHKTAHCHLCAMEEESKL